MKREPAIGARFVARALAGAATVLGTGLLFSQNFVRNPDFEEPLGPDNWTIVYTGVVNGPSWAPTNCGPNDFLVAGRTTMAHKDKVPGTWDGHPYYWSKFGGHFAPNHTGGLMHGYFRRVVSGLVPGGLYNVSAWMAQHSGTTTTSPAPRFGWKCSAVRICRCPSGRPTF